MALTMPGKESDTTLKARDITRMLQRDIDPNTGIRTLTNRRIVMVFGVDTTRDIAVIPVCTEVEREISCERYSGDIKTTAGTFLQ